MDELLSFLVWIAFNAGGMVLLAALLVGLGAWIGNRRGRDAHEKP